jgi:RNA polymerase sigma-70 factor (ECF subfamily)
VDEHDRLAERFEDHRGRLREVAYRMLGSVGEADDAVQEAWLRLARRPTSDIQNLGGWLTTVVGRVCLDMLRSRRSRREEPLDAQVVDDGATDPEHAALLADSVGLALLVVLDALTPAERLAFVLHDLFAVPFGEIAATLGRSPEAAKMLASRARRRVQAATPPDPDVARQREVVDAFLAAARHGDLPALVAVLDPDVTARADAGPAGTPRRVGGAGAVARQALAFSARGRFARPALVNGTVGIVVATRGRVSTVLTFTIKLGKIMEIEILADPARLRRLDITDLAG